MKKDMVSRIFENLNLAQAPAVITVDHGVCECVYIKQRNGYFGVPTEKSNNRKFRFGHNICLTEDEFQMVGHVYPPVTTNMLCQDKPGSRQSVTEAAYKDKITSILASIAMTCMQGSSTQQSITEITNLLKLPKWMSFVDGKSTDDEIRIANLAGVEEYLLEFAEVSGYKVVIDVLTLIESRVHKKFICVREGEWGSEAQLLAKSVQLPSGVITLAKAVGVALKDARATSKRSKKTAQKTG